MESSDRYTIEDLFDGRAEAFLLFKLVKDYIESIGSVKVEVTRTQVSFGADAKFSWVWLPQLWVKKRPENSITLFFSLDHRILDGRIAGVAEPCPGRWMHHVVLEDVSDFDGDLRNWLKEAYVFAGGVLKE